MKKKEIPIYYQIIFELSTQYPVNLLCELAKVSRSGYYKWLKQKEVITPKKQENEVIKNYIVEVYEEANGTYGYPRITASIRQQYEIKVNHKRIYRLMKEMKLQAKIRKKRQRYREGSERIIVPNVLNRNFIAENPNKKWVTDITYLIFNNQRLYLSVICDLWNKEIVAYKISSKNGLELVLDTLEEANKKRDVTDKTILHSDQGFQYTSQDYHEAVKLNGITQSMSRKANFLDNACAENFFSHFKTECMYLKNFQKPEEVIEEVEKYIYRYNHKRIQKKLGYLSPVKYRLQAA
ncbi:IS3 family transposase [Neobacillus bataviensis]|uniref:IS3 family transposase n=1 Tax=Neobacillus bataviensis TaxID=220685 RepID=UPI001CBDA5B3|nr:IS3 family transposase [Neobacillus bataviensis]